MTVDGEELESLVSGFASTNSVGNLFALWTKDLGDLSEWSDARRFGELVTKWKTESLSSGDVYQLTSYILALDTCDALVYLGHSDRGGEESTVMNQYSLRSIELATNAAAPSYQDFAEVVEMNARSYLTEIL